MKRREEREETFKIIYESLINEELDYAKALENHEIEVKKKDYIYLALDSFSNNKDELISIFKEEVGPVHYKSLNMIDKAIILTSLNEMAYLAIPPSVSINEAVELSKKYSDRDSYKYVNSVLGSLSKKEFFK